MRGEIEKDEDAITHSWEESYKRSWDALQEDESGNLDKLINSMQNRKVRRIKSFAPLKRGMIRHVYIIIDMSRSMTDLDLRPSRLLCTLEYTSVFINEFFDQNPLSQIGIIITRDGLAEKISELSPHPKDHTDALDKKVNREPSGEISIQNALELAKSSLSHTPKHTSREILLYSSI